MDTESILNALTWYDETFPREALQQAIEQRESITPHLLESLRFARVHADDLPENYFLHTWAMFLLAQFRDTRAYPLIVDLFDLPHDRLEELHGDLLTEDAGRIFASVCGGDTGLIERLIENPKADEYARHAGIVALVTLVVAGERLREEVLEYLGRLMRTADAEAGEVFWSGLVLDANRLYPDLVREEIESVFARDLAEPFLITREYVEETLAEGKEAVLADLAENPHYRMVEDTIRESEWWACFQPAPPPVEEAAFAAPPAPAPLEPPPSNLPPVWPPPVPKPVNVGPKPGRNDPCPCGSGLKYKKCCLNKRPV